ncbi:MAG: hypothetical protein C0594_14130 [Marinilabiliales bacterium]|nr:MAG: hypothetical protein C0594_14130 [Marinilabiliales bacterium]
MFVAAALFAQSPVDVELQFSNAFVSEDLQHISYSLKNCSPKILPAFTSVLFVGYKKFISSQDASHCQFYPSCSVYATDAIEKYGFVIGVFTALDRLSRCNTFGEKNYPKYKNTGLYYDPVADN